MPAQTLWTRIHGRAAAGVPRWAVLTAYAIPLAVLPSGLWRIAAVIFHLPLMEFDASRPDGLEGGPWWYILLLSVVSEAAAFLAVGLVGTWGEVWPRWVPFLRGRRVPVMAAVVPAGLGALVLMFFPYTMVMAALGLKINGDPTELIMNGWQTAVFHVMYWPLAAWGPLLAVLTVHYYRRRTAAGVRETGPDWGGVSGVPSVHG